MSKAAQRLTFRPVPVGEYLGDEDPDYCSLSDGMRRDEAEDANRDDAEMLGEESPRRQPEREDITEGTNEKERAASQPVRLVTPMPTDCSKAAFAPKPVISKMRGAK